MTTENLHLEKLTINGAEWPVDGAQPAASGPAAIMLAQCAAAAMRRYLRGRGLDDYRIFTGPTLGLFDVDDHVAQLDAEARWEDAPPLIGDETASLNGLFCDKDTVRPYPQGCLWLPSHRVVIGWWNCLGEEHLWWQILLLAAAPSAKDLHRFRQRLIECRRTRGEGKWQMVGQENGRARHIDRPKGEPWAKLLLAPEMRKRIDTEILSFFTPEAAELYRGLQVPYRRGVLFHGPPGNGKTSIIRAVGGALTSIPAMILSPGSRFGTDELRSVFERWAESAPSILIIEDLDWLMNSINVSAFLNALDGIESSAAGLMLLASTNHIEKLDPAVSNRPGRFDVTLEIPCPDEPLRGDFFRDSFPDLTLEVHDNLVAKSAGLSFAHLREIVRLSGLLAIADQRKERSAADFENAVKRVAEENTAAEGGFRPKPEVPFGLAKRRNAKS